MALKKKKVPVREFWAISLPNGEVREFGCRAVKVVLQVVVLKRRSCSWELRILVPWAMGLDVPAWPAVLEKSWHPLAIAIVSLSRLRGRSPLLSPI